MKKICESPRGPLAWIKNNDKDKILAFYGSRKNFDEISSWQHIFIREDYTSIKNLSYGFSKDSKAIEFSDILSAAAFRGGQCLSSSKDFTSLDSKLLWQCAFKHEFKASVRLVLETGHFCPECEAPPWNYSNIAKYNKFFSQVYDKESI